MGDMLFPVLLDPPADRPALAFPDGALTYPELAARAGALAQEIAGLNRVAVWATPTLDDRRRDRRGAARGGPRRPGQSAQRPARARARRRRRRAGRRAGRTRRRAPRPAAQLRHIPADHPTGTRESARPGVRDAEAGTPADARAGDLHLRHDRPAEGRGALAGAIAANLDALADAWAWTAADTLVHALPLFHVHGLVLGVLGPLRRGGALRHLGTFSTSALADAIDGRRARSSSACPPTTTGSPTSWPRTRWPRPPSAGRGCSSPVRPRSPPSTTPGCTGSPDWPSASGTG